MIIPALLISLSSSVTPSSYLASVVGELNKEWPKNRMVEIVCHGHSVPAGYTKTPEVQILDAYPNLLREGLCRRFPHAVVNVTVTAVGGENSVQGEKRFAHDVLSRRPDVVTLDYGLNDRTQDPLAVRGAWQSMIRGAKRQGIKVILLTPTGDLTAEMDNPNDALSRQAVAIRRLAAEEEVGLADSFAAFQKAASSGTSLETLMAQFNHPNRRGHELVASGLLQWFPKP